MDEFKKFENLAILSEEDAKQLFDAIQKKFSIFYTEEEFSILTEIGYSFIVKSITNVSIEQFKVIDDGTFSVGTIYGLVNKVQEAVGNSQFQNPFLIASIFDKLLALFCHLLNEDEKLSVEDKKSLLKTAFGSGNKFMEIEGFDITAFFPRAHKVSSELLEKYNSIKTPKTAKAKRVPVPKKTKALLQKEINSECPIPGCGNEDVGHFEVHHINGNPGDNVIENLLLVCPTCHSKIEKNDITFEEVVSIKKEAGKRKAEIDIYDITIDRNNCSWEKHNEVKYSFFLKEVENISPFPILQFHILNNSKKTIVLSSVELTRKCLYSGLSGLPEPRPVPKSVVNRLIIKNGSEVHYLDNFDGVQIPSEQAYKLQIELLEEEFGESGFLTLDSRQILFFKFIFNDVTLEIPKVLLNTENENEGVTLELA